MPGQYARHFRNPAYDWCLQTTPQEFCNDAVYGWPRGKMLGGSSAINFFVRNSVFISVQKFTYLRARRGGSNLKRRTSMLGSDSVTPAGIGHVSKSTRRRRKASFHLQTLNGRNLAIWYMIRMFMATMDQ